MTRFVGFVSFVVVVGFVATAAQTAAPPTQDIPETDLHTASNARTIRLRLGTNGASRIVEMPTEVYVARVLAAEGEPRAGDAAQQALAIAIRTFAAANAGRHRREGFDLCDQTHCQVLRASTPATRLAAFATAGQVLMYEGRPAEVFYSASCGGKSEAASQLWPGAVLPYLRSASDDAHDGEEPWVFEVSLLRVEQALRRAGFDGRRLKDVSIESRTESGRVMRLELSGMRPEEIAGDDFRLALGPRELRSTAFDVKRDGSLLRFTGRGYGHGVGMCVVGAGRRAARGESATQILEQYFPGLRVQPVATSYASGLPATAPIPEHETAALPTPAQLSARRARDEIAATLRISDPPMPSIEQYDSLDAYRQATGRPWWVVSSVEGTSIALAPAAIIAQGDGLDAAIRRAVAEMLVRGAFADRPAWVRVGASRYYAAAQKAVVPSTRITCPTDAELTMAVSAPAQREAEIRAETCFARGLAKSGEWRKVK